MKRVLGIALMILGFIGLVIFGFWSLILDLRVLYAVGGFWAAVLGFFVFPVMVVFAPMYAVSVYGYWDPLIVHGLTIVSVPLIGLGAAMQE